MLITDYHHTFEDIGIEPEVLLNNMVTKKNDLFSYYPCYNSNGWNVGSCGGLSGRSGLHQTGST